MTQEQLTRADVRDEQEALDALRAEASPADMEYLDQEDARIKAAKAGLGEKTLDIVINSDGSTATREEVEEMRSQGQDMSDGNNWRHTK